MVNDKNRTILTYLIQQYSVSSAV